MAKRSRKDMRVKRHERVRKNLTGTPEKPRMCVFRSLKHIYVQVIDDTTGTTLASASSRDAEYAAQAGGKSGGNKEAAKTVGGIIAKRAIDKGISEVAFDRGGFLYHGRVKELADGAREAGLKF